MADRSSILPDHPSSSEMLLHDPDVMASSDPGEMLLDAAEAMLPSDPGELLEGGQQDIEILELTEENLEYYQDALWNLTLDRHIVYSVPTETQGVEQAMTTLALPKPPQDPATRTSPAPEANYRNNVLHQAKIFIYRIPIPEDLQPGISSIFSSQITRERKSKISQLAKATSRAFARTMESNSQQDYSVEVLIQALAALDAGKNFIMIRNAEWKAGLKPSFPQPELDLGGVQAGNEADRAVALSQNAPGTHCDNIETPRPHCTIALRYSVYQEAMSKLGVRPTLTTELLNRFQRKNNLFSDPTGMGTVFPILVVERGGYGSGKTMFDAENQAAVVGSCMVNLWRLLSHMSRRWMQEITPLGFSIVTQGPHIQFSVHFPVKSGRTTEYHMYPFYACNAINEQSLEVFLATVENLLCWSQKESLAEVTNRLLVLAQVRN